MTRAMTTMGLRAGGLRRPKVLFLTISTAIGGMERIALSLSQQFTAREWDVQTVFPQTPKTAPLLAWAQQQGVNAETHPALLELDAPHSVADIQALRRFVRASRPSVVNLHYPGSHLSIKDVLAVRLAGRGRCIASVHLPVPWQEAGESKRRLTRLAAYLCDGIIANSHATREVLLQAGVPGSKVRVVPCGVRVPERLPTRAEARAELGLPPEAFVLASHARLVPHKGVADLIEAAARVPDPADGLTLVVAGEGPQRAELEALAAARLGGRVRFLGHLPDPAPVYAAADLFALPTRLEGFGIVYVEAAFHGVPSVGTRTGGVPDAVQDGATGLLVPPGDIDALAAAIGRLRDAPDTRRQLGENARRRAHAEFTEGVMAGRYAALFSR